MSTEQKQVYIVDDDESLCRALSTLLVTFGFKVKSYTSAKEFLSAVPNSAPGCLILDIYMPETNGWETLRQLYASGSKRPVIAITAYKTAGLKELVLKSGVSGFFHKPIDDQELVDLINKVY